MRFAFLCLRLLAILPLVFAAFECHTQSGTTIVHDAVAEQRKRAASPLVAHLAQPWPLYNRNGRRLRIIKYCYIDSMVKRVYCQRVQAAFTIWANALGYPASETTGHNLGWEEAHNDAPPSDRKVHYCYLPGTQTWNPDVAKDTLKIDADMVVWNGAKATVGWRPEAGASGDGSGRHTLSMGPLAQVDAIVHELGHIFGMDHEFIRSDRDQYLLYQCRNVQGFHAALERATSTHPPDTPLATLERKLCEDWRFAEDHDFAGSSFLRVFPDAVYDDSPSLDVQSVMMYDSAAYANPECPGVVDACPLLVYAPPGQFVTKALIPAPEGPSAGDVVWVKKWYKWEG